MVDVVKTGSKINLDDLYDPIEIILEGKKYVVEKLTQPQMFKVQKIGESQNQDSTKPDTTLDRQLAALLNCSPEILVDVDIRKKKRAVDFLMETITTQLGIEPGKSKAGEVSIK